MHELTYHSSRCRNIYYFAVTKYGAKPVSKMVYRKRHLSEISKIAKKNAKKCKTTEAQ